jgi:hypothetical protein
LQTSFNSAEEIIGYLCRFGYTSANSVILVANKIDLERSRVISTEGDYITKLISFHFK